MYNYFIYWTKKFIKRFNKTIKRKDVFYDGYIKPLRKYLGCYSVVLDSGCGQGRFFKDFNSFCGVDISTFRLDLAKIYPNPICCGDINFLPFRNSAFPALCTVQVLMHTPYALINNVLKEFIRVTSDRIVHLEYYSERSRKLAPHCFNHNLKNLYNELGWKLVSFRRLYKSHKTYCWVFEELSPKAGR